MPRVIRYGQKKPKAKRWTDAEILTAYWEYESQVTGRPTPFERVEEQLNIPELNPVPTVNEVATNEE